MAGFSQVRPAEAARRNGEAVAAMGMGPRISQRRVHGHSGDPFLVVLDEPNAGLDAEGEHALTQTILAIRARGGNCVLVAHRPSVLDAVDHVLMMAEEHVRGFGPGDETLKRGLRPTAGSAHRCLPLIAPNLST